MGLLKKTNTTSEFPVSEKKDEIKQIIPKPRICCVDLTLDVVEALTTADYNLYSGTLGAIREVPNKHRNDSQLLQLDYDFPENFQEYDILVLDLTNEIKKEFKALSVDEKKTRGHSSFFLSCSFPTNIFDPRPLSASFLANKINEVGDRKFIQVVFASQKYEVDYEIVEITAGYPERHPNEKHSLYGFNPGLPISESRYGTEVSVCSVREDIYNLVKKYIAGITYEQTFHHPTEWVKEKGSSVPVASLFPLIRNINQEIISFVQTNKNFITFVFPNIQDKSAFLSDFFKNVLPALYPDVFPFSTQFKWIEHPEYYIPNLQQLLDEKVKLAEDFEANNAQIEIKISENNKRFKFLHELITETDDKLVHAIFAFLKFLEFKNVTIKDEESHSIREEDLQVELDNGILVIETKGIGGTSTDSDCSQISKIKHRRCKERNAFDVSALYIVNHQRFLPPLKRKNPPFTEQQLEDAKNDERGLLSTWQLFNLYNEIQNGLISKEAARQQMLAYGLIEFKPKLGTSIGLPKELYKNGQIAIVDIINTKIKQGDNLLLERDGIFKRSKIISLQLDGKDVPEVLNGEVGIKLDQKITKGTTLWSN
jgi:hypothetical protein